MTEGDLAECLCVSLGMLSDEWQSAILDDWLARGPDGRLLCVTAGLWVPRQNGKNEALLFRELYGVFVLGEKILHTAHLYKTAMKAFKRFVAVCGEDASDPHAQFPWLNAMVKKVTRSAGMMIIEARNGGLIDFSTRTDSAGRGETYDLLVIDEAQELTDSQLEALDSVNSAAPSGSPQTIFTGTPPTPGGGAYVFARLRRSERAGGTDRSCWSEWSVEEVGDVANVERWYATNPALGVRLEEFKVAAEAAKMTPEGFARERLGWYPLEEDAEVERPIRAEAWEACRVEPGRAPQGGLVSFGVKFTQDGSTAVVAACAVSEERGAWAHVEVAATFDVRQGADALSAWLMEREARTCLLAIDGAGKAQALAVKLQEAGYPPRGIHLCGAGDLIVACSMLEEAVDGGHVSHIGDRLLTSSATMTEKRPVGKGGGWGFKSTPDADAAPAEAAAIAHWAARTTKRLPEDGVD